LRVAGERGPAQREAKGSSSFLKKRTKKLLFVARGSRVNQVPRMSPKKSKSFLFLFFKKEILPSFLT
jgi:hypothetical protein